MTTPRIGILGAMRHSATPASAQLFAELGQLLAAPPCDLLLLDVPAELAGQALTQLRRHPHYAPRLIYTRSTDDALCQALSNGPIPAEPQDFNDRWQHWRDRFAHLDADFQQLSGEARILSWLWLHPASSLKALRDPGALQGYRYPLIEVFDSDASLNPLAWPQAMQQQGWLREDGLVDRVRLCADCGSGRLNFVDVCPECHAIDIAREHSLHCFTCGHVGPQALFLKNGALVCPNCLTRLRHIGSDYDRPLENYRCRACDAFFIDARVEAHCLSCGARHTTEHLHVREIRDYQLSESGRLRCRQHAFAPSDQDDAFMRLHLIGARAFNALLDWQIGLIRRHGRPPFCVVGLRFANLSRVLAHLGAERAHPLIDSVVERLREQLRDTDLCTRVSDEQIWMLLPHTNEAGCRQFVARLGDLDHLFASPEAREIRLHITAMHAPDELPANEDAPLLLARLAAELA